MNRFSISLKDISGKSHKITDYLGKSGVLLVFFKNDCPTCQFTLPFIERLYKIHGDERVKFLGIGQDDKAKTERFVKEYELSFSVLIDKNPFELSKQFDFQIVPTIMLLNKNGEMIQNFMGFNRDELEKLNHIIYSLDAEPVLLFSAGEDIPDVKPG